MEDFEYTDTESEGEATSTRGLEEYSSSASAEVSVVMVGPSSGRLPVIVFNSDIAQSLSGPLTSPFPSPYRVTFKFGAGQASYKIVNTTLLAHGFREVSSGSSNFNLLWSGTHCPKIFRNLRSYQKVNHFPRCSEITRKDRLVENVRRMQKSKGVKHFNIIPKTFLLPDELNHFNSTYRKLRGTWIIKPTSLSRGRGISLINHPNQLPRDETIVVSKYIQNPLCVDGYKFDLRLYVAVTSFNPLKIYLYEEGLTRFATVRYAGASEQLGNRCMHLTNYSVNKTSDGFVRCEDPTLEDYGNKWSLSALLRQLQEDGINVTELMMRVEDVIVKTIICGEVPIVAATKVLQTQRGNCFELFGFDILIDEHLKPWVLEVNLSPSVACDAPLDLRIKSNLIADLLSLAGITLLDPFKCDGGERYGELKTGLRTRRSSGGVSQSFSAEDVAIVRETKEEYARRGGFVRLFPSEDSWELYGSFLEDRERLNFLLHQQLYPESIKNASSMPAVLSSVIERRLQDDDEEDVVHLHDRPTGLDPRQRTVLYTRRLFRHSLSKPTPSTIFTVEYSIPSASSLTQSDLMVPMPLAAVSKPSQDTCMPSDHVTTMLDHVIKNVGKLSKYQAREVFASYLEHVQKRLVRETSLPESTRASPDQQNAVNVVVTFLKKAASNLKTSFTVVDPKPSLPLREQQRLLARQLADFILLYRKETGEQTDRDGGIADDRVILSSEVLEAFLSQASESDLEKVLGAYAIHRRSSSVFLGSADTVSDNASSRVDHSHSGTGISVDHKTDSQSMIYNDTSDDLHRVPLSSISLNSSVGRTREVSSESREEALSHHERWSSNPPPGIHWVDGCEDRCPTPRYQEEMLRSSGLSVSQQESLDLLTMSLSGFTMTDDKQPEHVTSCSKHSSKLNPHKASSEMTASHYQSGSSMVSLGRSPSRPGSAVIVSKTKPYISPYAQSVVRPKSLKKNSIKKKASIKIQPPLHPASSEESITRALQRLSHRHGSTHKLNNDDVSSRKRPPLVAKTKQTKSTVTVNAEILNSNTNNSNNSTPSTMRLTSKRRHSSHLDHSSHRRSRGRYTTKQETSSSPSISHQTSISGSLHRTQSTAALIEGQKSANTRDGGMSVSYSGLDLYGHSTPGKSSRSLYMGQEMSPSEDLMLRIQEHNQAIAEYIQMQRYHSYTPPIRHHHTRTYSPGTPSSHFMTPQHFYRPHTGTF